MAEAPKSLAERIRDDQVLVLVIVLLMGGLFLTLGLSRFPFIEPYPDTQWFYRVFGGVIIFFVLNLAGYSIIKLKLPCWAWILVVIPEIVVLVFLGFWKIDDYQGIREVELEQIKASNEVSTAVAQLSTELSTHSTGMNDDFRTIITKLNDLLSRSVPATSLPETVEPTEPATETPGSPEPPPTEIPEGELLFEDDFNYQKMDETKWDLTSCPQTNYEVVDGKLKITLSIGDKDSCMFTPKIESNYDITRASIEISIQDGTNDFGYLGMFTYCGERYLNFLGTAAWLGITRPESPNGIMVDQYRGLLPYDRQLILEKKDFDVFAVTTDMVDISKRNRVSCFGEFLNEFAVGAIRAETHNGTVIGYIDNVQVWGVPVVESTPTPER